MKSPEEIKLVRAISTPGLFRDLEPIAGRYTNDLDDVIPGDEARTRYAVAMIGQKRVRFLTIHMAGFDHVEHEAGPYSAEAFRVLEAIDGDGRRDGDRRCAPPIPRPSSASCPTTASPRRRRRRISTRRWSRPVSSA